MTMKGAQTRASSPAEAVYGVGVGEVVYELRVEWQFRRLLGRGRAAAPGGGGRVGLATELYVARGDLGARHRADVVLGRVQRRRDRHLLGEPLVEQAHGHAGWSVVDRPERHDRPSRPRGDQAPCEADDVVAAPAVARRKDGKLRVDPQPDEVGDG